MPIHNSVTAIDGRSCTAVNVLVSMCMNIFSCIQLHFHSAQLARIEKDKNKIGSTQHFQHESK